MEQDRQASIIRPTDDEARRLARVLARGSRFGALAVLEPGTAHPFASRVLIGNDIDGVPVMLTSMLATHTRAVLADPRCSLLLGEPGKGDPLAWPRLTILADARRIESDTESHSQIRHRFLRRHPKAALYVDFPDFAFFRLEPKAANLNGGFGKAHNILSNELKILSPALFDIAAQELQILETVNARKEGRADLLVKHFFKEKTADWKIVGLDASGMEFARKEQLLRFEFKHPAMSVNGLIELYNDIIKYIR